MSKPVAQVGLIHGGGIEISPTDPRGWQLQPGSEQRAIRGVELFFDGAVERLLFTGGNAHGNDLPQSEAGQMADIAVRAGVPASNIETEGTSSSTIGNWANSLPILGGMGVESVLGVTGRWASTRARRIGSHMMRDYSVEGLQLTGYEPSNEAEGVKAIPREAASLPAAELVLRMARKQGVPLSELDQFYRNFRSQTGIAKAKKFVTHR